MVKLGTLEWTIQRHGKLGLRDKLAMTAQAVIAKVATNKRLAANIKLRHIEVDEIVPPDSAIARETMKICETASPPFLFNHCLRAYFWARLLDNRAKPFDNEALFTAFMLHDMGLTDSYRLSNERERCFTIVGARMAEEFGQKYGWSDRRTRLAANAITLHLNVTVDPCHGREAEMLRIGSGADVAGLGMDVLHDDQIAMVCAKFPRLKLKDEMSSVLSIETQERPGCRIAFLQQKLGFSELIRRAPMFKE